MVVGKADTCTPKKLMFQLYNYTQNNSSLLKIRKDINGAMWERLVGWSRRFLYCDS